MPSDSTYRPLRVNAFISMKRLFTLVLALVAGWAAQAQVTITQADMPVSGDTLRYSVGAISGIALPTGTGTGQTWNYSNLSPQSQGIAAYKSATSVNIAYGLLFGFTSYGLKLADTVGVGPVTATNVYDFYKRNSTSFSAVGRGLMYQGIPLPANYSNVDEIYQFPLEYGDRDSSTFRVQFSAAGQGTLTQQGYRINHVIGSGSLTTPYGTFNTLLVEVKVFEVDSVQAAALPFPLGFTSNTTHLVWLAQGQHYPILDMTVNTTTGTPILTDVRYRDIYRQLVPVAPQPDFVAIRRQLTVGDSTGFANLTPPGTGPTSFAWDITPTTGWNFTFGTTANSRNPVVKFTAPGLYSVGLRATVGAASSDTVKQDYIQVLPATGVKALAATPQPYPNPADGYFDLAAQPGLDWQIVNAAGQRNPIQPTITQAGLRFSTQALAPGIYLLQASPQNGGVVQQIRIAVSH